VFSSVDDVFMQLPQVVAAVQGSGLRMPLALPLLVAPMHNAIITTLVTTAIDAAVLGHGSTMTDDTSLVRPDMQWHQTPSHALSEVRRGPGCGAESVSQSVSRGMVAHSQVTVNQSYCTMLVE
jgi:hypothetical protein